MEGLLEEHGRPLEAMVSELLQEASTRGQGSPTLGQGPGLSGVPSQGGISTHARLVEPTWAAGLVCGKKGPG